MDSIKKGQLLWRMHSARCNALKYLGDDVERMVQECLFVKMNVDAVEDSNLLLSKEYRMLRSKYEELLEKNKKDSNIIMELKNSEAQLRDERKGLTKIGKKWLESDFEKQNIELEKFHLEDEKGKFLLKCRAINKSLYSIDKKQTKIQDLIEKQHNESESDRLRHEMEIKYLNTSLEEDSNVLKEFKTLLQRRDAVIESLQKDITEGLKASIETKQAESQGTENAKETEAQQESNNNEEEIEISKHEVEAKNPKQNYDEDSDEGHDMEWRKSKAFLQAAEKENKYLMQMYSSVNERMHEISSEILKVKECIVEKESQRRKLLMQIKDLEALVSMKRRKFEVPSRDPVDELSLRIEVQRELNEILHDFACRCLSFMQEDEAVNSSMREDYREGFLSVLRPTKKKSDKIKKEQDEHSGPSEDNA